MAITFSPSYDPTQPISWGDRATQGFKPRFKKPIPLSSPFSSAGADESYVGKRQPWELGKEDTISKNETFTSGFSEPITRVTATPSGSGFFSPDGKSPITFAGDFAVENAPPELRNEVSKTASTFETPIRRYEPSSSETSNTIDRAVSVSGDPTRGVSRTVETGKIEREERPVYTSNRATQGIDPRPTVPSERATQGYRSPSTSIFNAIDRGVNEGINQERAGVEVAKASQGLGSRLVRNFSPGSEYLNVGYKPGAANIATKAGNISEDAATFTQLFGDDLSQVGKTAAGTGKWYPRNLQELGEMNPFQPGGAKGGIGWSFGKGSSTGPTPLTRQVVKRTAASPVGRAISNVASTSAAKGAGKFLGKAVPVAGTSLAIWDAQNRFSEGDIVGGTLSGIGAIPGFGLPALGAQVVYDAVDGKGRLTRLGENIGNRVGDFLTRNTRADTARTLAEIEAMRTPEQIANTRDQYVDKMGNVKKGVTKDRSGQATGFALDEQNPFGNAGWMGADIGDIVRSSDGTSLIKTETGWGNVPATYWEDGKQFEVQPEVRGGIKDGQWDPNALVAPEGRTEITNPWSMENLQRKGLLDDGTLIASSGNLPGLLNSGGEDNIAFWGGKKETVVDPSKRQGRATDMNLVNYVNSNGSMGALPDGWTMDDAREYVRNRDAGKLQSFNIPSGGDVQIASAGDLTGLLSEESGKESGLLSQAELREKYGDPNPYGGYTPGSVKWETDADGRKYIMKPNIEWTQEGNHFYKDWDKVYMDEQEQPAEKGFLDNYIKDPEVDDSWKSELPGWISSPSMREDGSVWGYNYSGGYGNVWKGGDMDAKHMGQEGTWGFTPDKDVDVPVPWSPPGGAYEPPTPAGAGGTGSDTYGTYKGIALSPENKSWIDPDTDEIIYHDAGALDYYGGRPKGAGGTAGSGTAGSGTAGKNVKTGEQGFLDNYIKNPEGYDSNLDQEWKAYTEASEDAHAKMAKTRIEAGYDPGWRRGDEIWVNPEQARKDWEAEGAPAWGETFEKGQPKIMDWPDDGYYDSLNFDKYSAEDFKDDKPTQSTDLPSLDQLQSGEGYIKNVDTGEVTKIGGSKPGGVNTSSTTNLNPKSEPYQMYSEQELDDMDWFERKYKGDPQYQAAQRDYDRAMDEYMAADRAWKAYDQTYLTGGGNSRVGRDDDVEIANSRVAEVERLFDISSQKMQAMQDANTRLNNTRNTLLWGNPHGPERT